MYLSYDALRYYNLRHYNLRYYNPRYALRPTSSVRFCLAPSRVKLISTWVVLVSQKYTPSLRIFTIFMRFSYVFNTNLYVFIRFLGDFHPFLIRFYTLLYVFIRF